MAATNSSKKTTAAKRSPAKKSSSTTRRASPRGTTPTAPPASPPASATPSRGEQTKQLQARLIAHGFPCGRAGADGIYGGDTRAAVSAFQRAFAGGRKNLPVLGVDGSAGPRTLEAIAELPYLSPHFTVAEARSKGNGNCYVDRRLLEALEVLRASIGNRPIYVASMYRDPDHNERVGGARFSMHLYGVAADINGPDMYFSAVQHLELFSGIGTRGDIVRHVDLRHLAGSNNHSPAATPQDPSRWFYS